MRENNKRKFTEPAGYDVVFTSFDSVDGFIAPYVDEEDAGYLIIMLAKKLAADTEKCLDVAIALIEGQRAIPPRKWLHHQGIYLCPEGYLYQRVGRPGADCPPLFPKKYDPTGDFCRN